MAGERERDAGDEGAHLVVSGADGPMMQTKAPPRILPVIINFPQENSKIFLKYWKKVPILPKQKWFSDPETLTGQWRDDDEVEPCAIYEITPPPEQ
ncbi:hypothetical protein L484_022033 [Morus notabilis]|uniref:Uncharacterized protein n=1 Tax=Morus notabilis TaxID=981085 RepID=W9SDU3_9ROSA|nr:hypothetical protein L484_022033 [Morus notabilis]